VTADDYARAVAFELRDLPWRQRSELVAELRDHLAELPAETNFHGQLGPPERYAAELRSAAGLERRRGPIAFLRARRPRNLIATVAALALVGLAIGTVVWVDSYQPLVLGNGYQFPTGKALRGLSGESAVFKKGKPFAFGIEVVNSGRFSVRVLGVPYGRYVPWKATLMMSRPMKNTGGMSGPYVRFQPADLRPGQVIFLFFKGVYACSSGEAVGGGLTFVDFPIRYSFLWRTTTFQMPLPEDLAITFPKGCPSPGVQPPTP
jgi:hypothetical protein